jgi:hypothetical protein
MRILIVATDIYAPGATAGYTYTLVAPMAGQFVAANFTATSVQNSPERLRKSFDQKG